MAWRVATRDDVNLIGGWAFVPGGADVHDEMVSRPGAWSPRSAWSATTLE
ncbi:MAG: hypothetical protein M0Z30_05675 [Actinomycetota bacterium]|nr:hypothetical protein [Actinomycetota bacterium]